MDVHGLSLKLWWLDAEVLSVSLGKGLDGPLLLMGV